MHSGIRAVYQKRMSECYFDIRAGAEYIVLNVEMIFCHSSIVQQQVLNVKKLVLDSC